MIGLGAFYVLTNEQSVQQEMIASPAANAANGTTRETANVAPTQPNPQPLDAYNVAVKAIEKKYPQLNPASQVHNEALAREVVRRAGVYVQAGAAPADALKRVILEMERERDASKRTR